MTVLEDPRSTPASTAVMSRESGSLLRHLAKSPTGITALSFLVLGVLVGILGPLLAPHDPGRAVALDVLGPITPSHPLGSDSAGRDVMSRLLFGTRFTLAGAALALVVAAVLGVTSGLIAGYYGKWFDRASNWSASLLQALPNMVVLLAALAVLGREIWLSMAIFGVLLSPAFFYLTYAAVTAVRNELYVDAARVSGLSDARIIARHILPVVRGPILVQAAIVSGIAIAVQSGLAFLGLGDLSIVTWGSMLSDGFGSIYQAPILMVWPSIAIAITCISLVLLGNALRDGVSQTRRRAPRRMSANVTVAASSQPVITHPELQSFAGEQVLRVTDLVVGYPQVDGSVKLVIENVSLAVHRGEVHGLVGESGSGKTQTAWAILRLLPEGGRVLGGSILFEGNDLSTFSERQMQDVRGSRIAYVPQEPMSNLDPSFRIGAQLVEPLRVKLGLSKEAATGRALELLDLVGIPNPRRTFEAFPHEISGGMAQRVLIAGAVSCSPDLLIADEPTTALDVTVQAEILDLLRGLQNEFQMGMILVTHNFGVVADICDTVSVMREGHIVETGPVRSIFAAPQHPYTQSLFEAILDETGAQVGPEGIKSPGYVGQVKPS